MADGKWVMNDEDTKRVDLSFGGSANLDLRKLPNFGKRKAIDNRNGDAELKCALCGATDLQSGFGGCGEGFGYKSYICKFCGGTTKLVYKDDINKFFK